MKIGIGITTYNRPECLDKCVHQILTHTPQDGSAKLFIATDTDSDRKGVAFRKNECLRALKDCDHIFLFDDDCWPIKDGWIEFFVGSGAEHLLFLNETIHGKARIRANFKFFDNCGGVFMYMIKEAVERVGAFDEKFEMYGFEHADYSDRIRGIRHSYPMVVETEQYLHAEDYLNPDHKSSITDKEKKKHVRNNWDKYFKEPIKQIYIPL